MSRPAAAGEREEVLARLAVSRETVDRLDTFVNALRRWQDVQNLVAPSTLPHIWTRHVLDSAQLLPLTGESAQIVDLGSGAGFPGLVLAILLMERSARVVHLVESNQRKAAFLREIARLTGAPALVHPRRIEAFMADTAFTGGVITARALAPLPQLLALSERLLKTGARGIFPKGREAAQELTDSQQSWRIDAELVPSVTDPDASIVHIRSATRDPSLAVG
jgi:16S rRNA (guanine527-N7)-methyltransferase